jgi:histidinol-phosphate aminotransferase
MSRFPREDYRKLRPYDPGRTPVAVDLSDNTNLWGPHPAALQAVRGAPDEVLTRYPSVYAGGLKEALARKLGVAPVNVTTGGGSDDLLDSVFRAAALPPGRMVFPEPTFSMIEPFARMNGLEPRGLTWEEAEDDPARLLAGSPDLVYLCRPNNPTGLSTTREWVLELLALAGPRGPVVVLDEAYADFAGEHMVQDALASQRLLVLRTLSKLYGLAGLRVGFGIGSPTLIGEVEKSRGPYKVSQVAERAAVAALDDATGWVESTLQRVVENRERLARELRARGLAPLPSRANFVLFPVAPPGALALNQALKERGVATRPFPGLPQIGDALRVTVGPWAMMMRFLDALDEALAPGEEGAVRP